MKLSLAAWLHARPIEGAQWSAMACTLDESHARNQRHALDTVVLQDEDAKGSSHAVMARAREALFRYAIFPPTRMRSKILSNSGRIEVGATIVQQVQMGPLAFEAAVRVTALIEQDDKGERVIGFEYTTLPGHPEQGIARFTVRQLVGPHDPVSFSIETWSMPGHWISMLVAPFTRWMQRRSTKQALMFFKATVLAETETKGG